MLWLGFDTWPRTFHMPWGAARTITTTMMSTITKTIANPKHHPPPHTHTWCCCKLWHRSQMWLGSQVTVAVAMAGSSESTPSPGTSMCHRCGPKKQKIKNLYVPQLWLRGSRSHWCGSKKWVTVKLVGCAMCTHSPDRFLEFWCLAV